MRAIVLRSFGEADVLAPEQIDDPAPGPGEVLVRVQAVAVSSTRDIATRTGNHPFSRQVSLPHVLGGDCAGVVVGTGPGVDPSLRGRRVAVGTTVSCGACPLCRSGQEALCPELSMLGIHRRGSYAELVAVPSGSVREIPDSLTAGEAAALAANGPIGLTQLDAGRVGPGTSVAVTGATGALATTLVALALARGARVVALSRRPDAVPGGSGLAACLDSRGADLAAALLAATAGVGVDVVVDNVASGEVFRRYYPALATGGRVVISGAIGPPDQQALPVPAGPLYLRSQSLLGVRTTTPRDVTRFWASVHEGFRLPAGLVTAFPLEEAALAHRRITAGDTVGPVVLTA